MEQALRKLSMAPVKTTGSYRRQQKRKLSHSTSPRGPVSSGGGILGSLSHLAGYKALPAGMNTRQSSGRPTVGPNIVVSAGARATSDLTSRAKRRARKKRQLRREGPATISTVKMKTKFTEWVPSSGTEMPAVNLGAVGEKKTATAGKPVSDTKLSRTAKQRQRKRIKRMQGSQSESTVSGSGQNSTQTAVQPSVESSTPAHGSTESNGGENSVTVANGSSAKTASQVPKRSRRSTRRREKKRCDEGGHQQLADGAAKVEDRTTQKERNEPTGKRGANVGTGIALNVPKTVTGALKAAASQLIQKQEMATVTSVGDKVIDPTSVAGQGTSPESRPMSQSAKRRAKKRRRVQNEALESESAADGKPAEEKSADVDTTSASAPSSRTDAEVPVNPGAGASKRKAGRKRKRPATRFGELPPSINGDYGDWKVVDSVTCEPESEAGPGDGNEALAQTKSQPESGTDADPASLVGSGGGTSHSAKRRARKRRWLTESLTGSESHPAKQANYVSEKTAKPSAELSSEAQSDPTRPDAELGSQVSSAPAASEQEKAARAVKRRPKRNQRRKTNKAVSGDSTATENGTESGAKPAATCEQKATAEAAKSASEVDMLTVESANAATNKASNQSSVQRDDGRHVTGPQANHQDGDNDSGGQVDRRWWWKNSERSGERPEGDEKLDGEGVTNEKPLTTRAKRRLRKRRAKDRMLSAEATVEPTTGSNNEAGVGPTPAKVTKIVSVPPAGDVTQPTPEPGTEGGSRLPAPAELVTAPSAADKLANRKAKRAEKLRLLRQRRRQAHRELKAAGAKAAAEAKKEEETSAKTGTESGAAEDAGSNDKAPSESAGNCDTSKSAAPATAVSATSAVNTITSASNASVKSTAAVRAATVVISTADPAAADHSVTAAAAAVPVSTEPDADGAPPLRRRQRRRRGAHPVSQPGRLLMGGTINDPLNLAGLESPDEPREGGQKDLSSSHPLGLRSDPARSGPAANTQPAAGTKSAAREKPGDDLPRAPVVKPAETAVSVTSDSPGAAGCTGDKPIGDGDVPAGTSEGVEPTEASGATASGALVVCDPGTETDGAKSDVITDSAGARPAGASEPSGPTTDEASVLSATVEPPTLEENAEPAEHDASSEEPNSGSKAAAANGPAADEEFDPRKARFQYGNYNRYYGYRNADGSDGRLACLRAEWFHDLDVLDVGCNIGHVTLTVARDHRPRRCVGVDIDSSLIKIARKNVKHYRESRKTGAGAVGDIKDTGAAIFPGNISFVHANFVLESDALLETVKPEFDTVLCLSITKWIHLNFGDAGLRRFLRRVYLCLRPGGRLLLEPQPWNSYLRYKKLTPKISETFGQLQLRPDQFPELLQEMGFLPCQLVEQPSGTAASGFGRQLQLFQKPGERPSGAPTAAESASTTADPPAVSTEGTSTTADRTSAVADSPEVPAGYISTAAAGTSTTAAEDVSTAAGPSQVLAGSASTKAEDASTTAGPSPALAGSTFTSAGSAPTAVDQSPAPAESAPTVAESSPTSADPSPAPTGDRSTPPVTGAGGSSTDPASSSSPSAAGETEVTVTAAMLAEEAEPAPPEDCAGTPPDGGGGDSGAQSGPDP